MEEIVNEQIADQELSEVLELVLDQWKTETFNENDKAFLEKFENIDSLSLAGCGIKSLIHFPRLPNLIKLDLSGNCIKTGLSHLKHLSELMQINLIGNLVEDLNEFECFRDFSQLVYLEIENCPVATEVNVREKLFEMIESLRIIDGFDRDGNSIVVDNSEASDENQVSLGESDDEEDESEKLIKSTKGNDSKGKKK